MSDSEKAALAFARLGANIRRAAARSRRRANGSFDAMLAELESNAEQLDGFADMLEAVCEEFGLKATDEGRETLTCVEPEKEAPAGSREEAREVRQASEAANE